MIAPTAHWPASPKGGVWLPDSVLGPLVARDLRTGSAWRVLLVITCTQARYGGRGGYARLPISRLAEITGLSASTVKRALQRLIEAGLVYRDPDARRVLRTVVFERDEGAAAHRAAPWADQGPDFINL